MSLIPQDEMRTLKAASAVKAVATTAIVDQQRGAVAYAINNAANTGETSVVINSKLDETLITELEGQGYTLTYDFAKAKPSDEVVISWN